VNSISVFFGFKQLQCGSVGKHDPFITVNHGNCHTDILKNCLQESGRLKTEYWHQVASVGEEIRRGVTNNNMQRSLTN
jgi:hypothetical protein